jgi:hypothetical protein
MPIVEFSALVPVRITFLLGAEFIQRKAGSACPDETQTSTGPTASTSISELRSETRAPKAR